MNFKPVIPQGATVLVTGVNGLVGSHVAEQFLALGYNVRGTVRDPVKSAPVEKFLNGREGGEGRGKLQLVAVPDMMVEGCYDEAMKDVEAVIHVAAALNFSPDPKDVIPPTVFGTLNALRSAAASPTIKRFVLTSSGWAAFLPKPDTPMKISLDTWNDGSVAAAEEGEGPGKGDVERIINVYAASKVMSEKKAWEFVKEREGKLGFVFNTVLPGFVMGPAVDPKGSLGVPSTAGMVVDLFRGDKTGVAGLPSQQYIDTRDIALLHVATALHPGVESERILAWAGQVSGDLMLAALRKSYPGKTFPEDFQPQLDLSENEGQARAEELVREMGREKGFRTLEESIWDGTNELAE